MRAVSHFILIFFLFSFSIAFGQMYTYHESEGIRQNELKASILSTPHRQMLKVKTPGKRTNHLFEPPGTTKEWQLVDENLSHNFKATRTGKVIFIQGTYEGQLINKSVEIDEKPWINKLDHGLSPWVLSDNSHIVFWALKLGDDLEPIRFEATKLHREATKTPAGTFQTVKVKLNLHGFLLSNIWSAYCWYRVSDGLFVKYQGNSGPGTDIRTIELKSLP